MTGIITLTLRILPAHRRALQALSKLEQEHMAVIVRQLIRAEAEKRGVWPLKEGERCPN